MEVLGFIQAGSCCLCPFGLGEAEVLVLSPLLQGWFVEPESAELIGFSLVCLQAQALVGKSSSIPADAIAASSAPEEGMRHPMDPQPPRSNSRLPVRVMMARSLWSSCECMKDTSTQHLTGRTNSEEESLSRAAGRI